MIQALLAPYSTDWPDLQGQREQATIKSIQEMAHFLLPPHDGLQLTVNSYYKCLFYVFCGSWTFAVLFFSVPVAHMIRGPTKITIIYIMD